MQLGLDIDSKWAYSNWMCAWTGRGVGQLQRRRLAGLRREMQSAELTKEDLLVAMGELSRQLAEM